jgi:uncharacterized Zn-binding protein involved in type VI secretion
MAQNTVPNVCKMPGPPAPFVPTPLPNIGQSGKDPQGYSTTVKIEGQPVAIQGASFGSSGDVASKGTGGGIVSSNVEGPTKFIGPGSFTVKIEGKNVQLLSDPMMNNCGPGGSPPNAATMMGLKQNSEDPDKPSPDDCNKAIKLLEQPIRLAEKLGKKLPEARKAALRAKIANGTITSNDLPGSIQNEFPPRFKGKTLNQVREECGKSK